MIIVQPSSHGRPNLPDPPVRLAQAAFRLAWVALLCTQLPWSVPKRAGAALSMAGPGATVVWGAVAAVFASLSYVATRGKMPTRCVVLYSLFAALFGLFATLAALDALVASRPGHLAGPAGWVCVAMYAGVTALGLFTGSAVYERWRSEHCESPELTLARERLDEALDTRQQS